MFFLFLINTLCASLKRRKTHEAERPLFFVLSFVLLFAILLLCSQCFNTFAKVRKA